MAIADETQLSSHILTVFPAVQRVLVIAPHPDDEVFGCGASLAHLRADGVYIKTIIVTDGQASGSSKYLDCDVPSTPDAPDAPDSPKILVELRREESLAAARVLGLEPPIFWDIPDREVRYGEVLINRLMAAIRDCKAELVFLPSATDWNPDHQSLSFAGAEAVRRLASTDSDLPSNGNGLQAVFYEVTDPLPQTNLVCDITALSALKNEAMRCFKSQLQEQPYIDRVNGINCFRAMHLGAKAQCAEAFRLVTADQLNQGLAQLLEGELSLRRRQGHAAGGEDLPLVSVIVRSIDRPTLDQALNSIALQTWPNIEIVLVNAKGKNHRPMPATWGDLPLHFVDSTVAVPRSQAANRGLDAARGDYLMFLDDDDWFEANHVTKLVETLRRQPEFQVAYTGIRCVGDNGEAVAKSFDFTFDAAKLLTGNFIPIHATLFSRHFLDLGCRVDESLVVYEDWDFWLQLAKHGNFLHVEGTSAVYRIAGQGGFGVNADQAATEPARQTVYRKWLDRLGSHQITGLTQLIHRYELKDEQIASLNVAVELRDHHMAYLEEQIGSRDTQIAELNKTLGQRTENIVNLDRLLEHLNGQVAMLGHAVAERDRHIANYVSSTSWRITQPMRLISRLVRGQRPLIGDVRVRILQQAKRAYWRLPIRYRTPLLHWSYRHFGSLFKGMTHYEQWKSGVSSHDMPSLRENPLLSIDHVIPATQVDGRIAVHLHLYYHDLANEFANHLKNFPFAYDLYVSVANEEGRELCRKTLDKLPRQTALHIEIVPNRGRDIAPMFCAFGERLKNYDYIAHLHGKKSLYNSGATEGWREYLCEGLLGSEDRVRRIFALMQGDAPRGIVYPQNFHLLPYQANTWLANKAMGSHWCHRLGIHPMPEGYFDMPAGSMFWARGDALRPIFNAGITLDDFVEETGQTDGTFAHCLERLLVLSAHKQGYLPGIIRDTRHPNWSAWGFQQYTSRPYHVLADQLAQPSIKLIAFDIFDTLLCRPLMNAESVKTIVAERIGGETGRRYQQYRALAEGQARDVAGRDIGMTEIFAQLGELTGMTDETLSQLRRMEEEIEMASVAPRTESIALYRHALTTRKPVALISDMFLPRAVIEQSLQDCGIQDWDQLFLSNEIGVRKDNGKLYEHVLAHYGINAGEMLMIGDNERSDWQIPCDKGIVGIHLLRPVEFARGLPRLRSLIESIESNGHLSDELTLGLVLQHNYSDICYPGIDPSSLVPPSPRNVGYSLIGPLLLAMCDWLLESARRDEIDRLYFLSREGQLIKQVFDVWCKDIDNTPQSIYLILSRRATSVPMISDLDDILSIAKTTYFSNTIENFLFERYGLQLDVKHWSRLDTQLQWKRDSTVEVFDQRIDHLLPLLTELQDEIITRARAEHTALKHYLDSMGLEETGHQAVVDVGYGGTIQDYLNRLLAMPVHGYYMMTNRGATRVGERHGVTIRGCYAEDIEPGITAPSMFRHSFELEKLLSSSDAQVVHYELDESRNLTARHRELSNDEIASRSLRAALQEGVIQFAVDARNLRDKLFPGYRPSPAVAQQLYTAFIAQSSQQELDLLRQISLDDHYCGRGVVS